MSQTCQRVLHVLGVWDKAGRSVLSPLVYTKLGGVEEYQNLFGGYILRVHVRPCKASRDTPPSSMPAHIKLLVVLGMTVSCCLETAPSLSKGQFQSSGESRPLPDVVSSTL